MGFGDLKSAAGIKALNNYLSDKSYIEGFVPSQADLVIFEALGKAPSSDHALRWWNQIASYTADEQKAFVGARKNVDQYGPQTQEQAKPEKADDDDDDDLFGDDSDDDDSDEEEETEEQKAIREKRLAAYAAKKANKKAVIAKSSLLLDVKPWDDETDMAEMERLVKTIVADGLLWGASKLVPLAYGIKKLQINAVIEDDKISTDFLEEEITKFSDYVQSMDIAAFNKI